MQCRDCKRTAKFKCGCHKAYLCSRHLKSHSEYYNTHSYEKLDIELEEKEATQVKRKLLEEIQKINLANFEFTKTTEKILKELKFRFQQFQIKLNAIKYSYMDLLNRTKFCRSEMLKIKEILNSDIIIESLDIDKILNEINYVFTTDLIFSVEKIQTLENQFLSLNSGGFLCGAITTDSKTLVTGGHDATIRVWDLDKNKQKFVLFGHNSNVKCLTLTADSQFIISGSNDATVRVWDLKQKKQASLLKGHKGVINAISYVESRSLIISGDSLNKIIIWDFTKRARIKVVEFSKIIFSMAITKNQLFLITGVGRDILKNDLENFGNLNKYEGHKESVLCIIITCDDKRMVSGSLDNSIIIWDVNKRKKLFHLKKHNGQVNCLSLTLNEEFVVSGSDDRTVRVWYMKNGDEFFNLTGHNSYVTTVLRVRENFLSLSKDSSFGVIDFGEKTLKLKWFLEAFDYDLVDFSANSRLLGFGRKDKVCIWDMEKQKIVSDFGGHSSNVLSVEISRDGRFAISCSIGYQKNLFYWDLKSNKKISELKGHSDTVFCANFSYHGLTAATGSGDMTVIVWDLKKCDKISKLEGHNRPIYSIKFLNRENYLVTAGGDYKIIVWDLSSSIKYFVFEGHNQYICRVIVTNDDKYIISADLFDGIRIWDIGEIVEKLRFNFKDEKSLDWLIQNGLQFYSVKRFLKLR